MGIRVAQSILLTILLFVATQPASGGVVGRETAERVCRNWMTYLEGSALAVPAAESPEIAAVAAVEVDGVLLGWHFELAPRGFVIVPARDDLPPVFAASSGARWPDQAENPFLVVARDVLADRFQRLDKIAAGQGRSAGTVSVEPHHAWARYSGAGSEFATMIARGDIQDITSVGPLLTTQWRQEYPFNDLCPTSEGGRTYVGCTATATAQLMRYHQWPPMGVGVAGYQWDGDSCDSSPTPEYLEVDTSDPYDWSLMPDDPGWDPDPAVRDAVAELCYEVAVACRMDFSTCGSGASISMASSALRNMFYYAQGIREVTRFRYTEQGWFDEIRDDIDSGQPVIYATIIHTIVCDGWRVVDGMNQIHLNYGWGGASDTWYTLDDIETSANPYAERLLLDVRPDPDVVFPVDVTAFDVSEAGSGLTIDWEVTASSSATQFWVYRAGGRRSCIPLQLSNEPLSGLTAYEYIDATTDGGEYSYWLQGLPPVGEEVWFGPVRATVVVGVDETSPESPGLAAPVPNPANPRTNLSFTLAADAPTRLRVLDLRGRVVRTLVDDVLPAGNHEAQWNGRAEDGRLLPSASYFLRLESGGEAWTRKVVLAR